MGGGEDRKGGRQQGAEGEKGRRMEAGGRPFFDLYPVLGVKKMDYNDFKNIYNIILSKGHLSPEGLAQIQQIWNNMNDKRTVF